MHLYTTAAIAGVVSISGIFPLSVNNLRAAQGLLGYPAYATYPRTCCCSHVPLCIHSLVRIPVVHPCRFRPDIEDHHLRCVHIFDVRTSYDRALSFIPLASAFCFPRALGVARDESLPRVCIPGGPAVSHSRRAPCSLWSVRKNR